MKKLFFGLVAMVFLSATAQSVTNKNNPYDSAGILHNQILTEFLSKHGADKKMTSEKALEITNSICKSKKLEGKYLSFSEFNDGARDIKNNFRGVVSKSPLSESGKAELQKLFDYMLNNGFSGKANYKESVTFILELENIILKNKNLSKSDSEFLLKSTSVGRHSIGFWNDYYNRETTSNKNSTEEGPRWIRWLLVGAADICGGVAGGGAFSVVGAVGASGAANTFIKEAK
jgi:hypothetical protein